MSEVAAETLQRPTIGVTAPLGFAAGAAAAGIKSGMPVEAGSKLDVAVIYSERPSTAAAVFTTNRVKAAPVVISQLNLAGGAARAIVVNSGNANACTGSQGFKDALVMGKLAADTLDLDPSQVLVASTGVIGRYLPMDRIREGVLSAAHDRSPLGGDAAAQAIMTTDTRPKQAAATFRHVGRVYTVGGMAKGSGMIHLNMATMLGFLTTDAEVATADLDAALRRCADRTFNMVSIDGDMSTNDMLTLLANGAAGGPTLVAGDGLEEFEAALLTVCDDLARQLVRDGEGASRMFTVEVKGAASHEDARTLARTVVSSSLVKAAIHGADPNWGRIVAALGRAGCEMVLDRLRVDIGGVAVFSNGGGLADADLAKVAEAFGADEVSIVCDMGIGDGAATAYGCDLTPEYVHINADYTT
ncbi:MAG: glutamate N-acetyltransferase / amino-acid N-acetyltransferase [Chloroflexota bacterium]|jgi:glutamate N-acetyltransferase/amino-acid N-acetyltransferase|nr:glutamate N-acetyltransferase / amino-acid N-acetyltransferase [Chloroflexota bacterium]